MEYARNRMNIVILDACRDNPFARSFRSGAQGLASLNAPTGTLIAYATAPGSVANDGQGENGIYTGELVKVLNSPGLKIEDVFKQVRASVREITQGKQVPWESSSLEGDFYFKAPAATAQNPAPTPAAGAEKMAATAGMSQTTRGDHGPRTIKSWKEPITGIDFVWIPGGCFYMGSPQSEKGREVDEGPVHEVCVKGFWMGKTEVTNGQFREFDPSHTSRSYEKISLNGDNQPAVYVSWEDANTFAQWLTTQNGGQFKFRLPTEAEWEYAARAGMQASRYWGDDAGQACEHENVADQSAKRLWAWDDVQDCDDGYAATAPVGSFQPNAFGLYDMLGNVSEWCEDIYSVDVYAGYERDNPVNRDTSRGPDRVIRGGHWNAGPSMVRCADRGSGLPNAMNDDLGVRIVREP
jgi:formylglycine-generating enzyme required for sulfatase activity